MGQFILLVCYVNRTVTICTTNSLLTVRAGLVFKTTFDVRNGGQMRPETEGC